MADLSDVETTLANLVTAILYPGGTVAPSLTGQTIRIFRGWPNAAALDADLAAGRLNVTIFPDSRLQQNTTRWPDDFNFLSPVIPSITIATTSTTATIGGTPGEGQLAGLLVDTLGVVRRVQTADTLATVAAALASDIAQSRTVQVNGTTLTIPGAGLIVGRVVADQPGILEARRQQQTFRISTWCPNPASRDKTAAAIDAGLSTQRFITLPDGTMGRLRFVTSTILDQSQDAALYRRDLLYTVEYATTIFGTLPSMIFGNATLAPAATGIAQGQIS